MKTRGRVCLWAGLLCALWAPPAAAEVAYSGSGTRDPFTYPPPEVVAPAQQPVNVDAIGKSLQVTGISYSEENPRAIINGKIVAIGDIVGKLGKLTRIERDGVTINMNGKEYFFKQAFKQTQGKSNDTSSKNA